MEFFATCAKGAEHILADELRSLGVRKPRPLASGVAFFGERADAYRALLWLRTASRVLLVLDRVDATNAEQLYAGVRAIAWEQHVSATGSIAVDARGTNDALKDTRFLALKVKDAIVDRLRELSGSRPSVDREHPDVRINVALRGNRATISLDLAGEPLHRRAYRVESSAIVAPLRETLAATMLLSAGLSRLSRGVSVDNKGAGSLSGDVSADNKGEKGADEGTTKTTKPEAAAPQDGYAFVLDPLCGSGTIAIEAALILLDRAPGLLRQHWGFIGWLGHDADLWDALLAEADERAESATEAEVERLRSGGAPHLYASDIDAAAVAVAKESAKRAGVAGSIAFSTQDIAHLSLPEARVNTDADAAVHGAMGANADTDTDTGAEAGAHTHADPHTHTHTHTKGLLITNPPYGERLQSSSQLPILYAALAALLKHSANSPLSTTTASDADSPLSTTIASDAGSTTNLDICAITPDDLIDPFLGGTPTKRIDTYNGPLETAIRLWQTTSTPTLLATAAESPAFEPPAAADPAAATNPVVAEPLDEQSEQFVNRLRKMADHRAKWARRAGVSCYRIYDADLPDYNVAIDLYEGAPRTPDAGQRWLHIAEYQPPANIDERRATSRLATVLQAAPVQLKVPTSNVYLKQRKRDKGGSQYAERDVRGSNSTQHLIAEDGLVFEVDFAAHLDTGIFLDHRSTRHWLREQARGKDCLNLFAYTGTASVFMAAGGAKSVTTLDLSNTYQAWAQRNMERNGFKDTRRYHFEQADALRWVQEQRHAPDAQRYDLIFVDPPTFSNSARMGTRSWDVQRDHVELLIAVSRLLAPGGQAVFSTNLRSFKLDEENLAKAHVVAKDITPSTIPPDFERNARIHHCYLLSRSA